MGATGPLPMPDNVRELHGTTTRTPEPRPQADPGVPPMPADLDAEAKAEWKRVTPELVRLGLLGRTLDRAVLTAYCDAWSKFCRARAPLAKTLTHTDKNGDVRKHPGWQIYREASVLVTSLAKELGLSPNARGRMRAPEPEPDAASRDLD
jgi:P27 family predicted phage terminase small subunit